MLAVTSDLLLVTANVVPSSLILSILMMVEKFLRNVGSYKSCTASLPRREHSSILGVFSLILKVREMTENTILKSRSNPQKKPFQ
jgi:hypothetical protein